MKIMMTELSRVPMRIQGRNLPQRVRVLSTMKPIMGGVDGVPHTGHQEQVAHKEGSQAHGVGEVDHQERGDHHVAQVFT